MTTLYYTKDDLYKRKPSNANIIISLDKDENKGNKYFMAFESATAVINFLEEKKTKGSHFHEVIPNMRNYSTYTFFDIDRELHADVDTDITDNYECYMEEFLEIFKQVFERFVKDMYNVDIKLVAGDTWQVSWSPKKNVTKLSCHIKINIKFPCMDVLKSFVTNFERYLTSNQYITNEEKSFFYFYKIIQGERKYVSIIDTSIYSTFRSLRILYSSKLKANAVPSIPFKLSSPAIKDHLVLFHPSVHQNIIPLDVTVNIEDNFLVDYSQKNQTHVKVSTCPLPKLESTIHRCGITPGYQIEELTKIKNVIMHSAEIKSQFKANIILHDPLFITPVICRFTIKKDCNCICPYANRTHKNNNNQFDYHYKNNIIKYTCFDEECINTQRQKSIIFKFTQEIDSLTRFNELNNTNTLHCQEMVIPWDEVYNSNTVRNYPLKQIVCVRAPMGCGKTKTLVNEFMLQQCSDPNTKCLMITYQILLSKKYMMLLENIGFKLYLDCDKNQDGNINDRKVIICLDSLWRMGTSNFDYIFVDEALSVLLHFKSPLMKNKNTISSLFELFFLQAKHIYMLDACIDNSIVVSFVNYMAAKKNVHPYWIRNTFIRPTNRTCKAIVNTRKKNEKNLKLAAMEQVAACLENGKKVVVSSSTKAFTENLEFFLRKKFDTIKNIMVYNSCTDKALMSMHAMHPECFWNQYDVLIYSPSVGAGLSFEVDHYDLLVSYVENSLYTPTVDFALQQMFRVRNLTRGEMLLYINDCIVVETTNHPTHDDDISCWMDKNIRSLPHYFPNAIESALNISENGLLYDRDKLSYHILKGIHYNTNKSLRYFTKILLKTLEVDYLIPTTRHEFKPTDDLLTRSIELFDELKSIKLTNEIAFDATCVISMDQFEELKRKEQRSESLTEREKLQKRIYQIGIDLWGVSGGFVDNDFFELYIGRGNLKKHFERFYQAMRCKDMFLNTLDINKASFHFKIRDILQHTDYNFELHNTMIKTYYKKLLEAQTMMDAVLPNNYKELLKTNREVIFESKPMEEKLKVYLDNFSAVQYNELVKLMNLEKSYKIQKDVNAYGFFKQVMNLVFNISVDTKSRGTCNNKRKGCGNVTRVFGVADYDTFINKYRPFNFSLEEKTWNLVDVDEDEF